MWYRVLLCPRTRSYTSTYDDGDEVIIGTDYVLYAAFSASIQFPHLGIYWAEHSISEHNCPTSVKERPSKLRKVYCDEPEYEIRVESRRDPVACVQSKHTIWRHCANLSTLCLTKFYAYKENHLAHIRLPEASTLINFHHQTNKKCRGYVNPYTTQKGGEYCLAIVHVENVPSSSNQLRYKFNKMSDWKEEWTKKKGKSKEQIREDLQERANWAAKSKTSTGFFPSAAPQEKDRDAMILKMLPFLETLPTMEASLATVLRAWIPS